MHNLIKSRALFEILRNPLPEDYFDQDNEELEVVRAEGNMNEIENMAGGGTIMLNPNTPEFVPGLKKGESTKDEDKVNLTEFKKKFQTSDEQKEKLTSSSKGSSENTEKSLVVLSKDEDHTIVPRIKGLKKSTEDDPPKREERTVSKQIPPAVIKLFSATEKRRSHRRKVAVEAVLLAEERRMRTELVSTKDGPGDSTKMVQPEVHLSRSPIKFSPEERVRVDRMRIAKRERIEKALMEMEMEKKALDLLDQQKKDGERKDKSGATGRKRYIPTSKEWDEQRRAKHLARLKSEKGNANGQQASQTKSPATESLGGNGMSVVISSEQNPEGLAEGETRRGNLTHFKYLHTHQPRRAFHKPLQILIEEKGGGLLHRYSIETLLELEPQPGDLEKPSIDDAFHKLGFICK
ncbi:uncharacterized protein LOC108095311 isoform X2 [Drosophila ficusphila]|uniref:uncharacterized protein LOC108095311 isoform X2 n=1 Tax=Drosophila ficusphila TaxID=30025 RepID=UPI0007E8ADEF|nr:uncharacterized protein LOC108095311 isoform X2 [Drosophila ficusphila]